MGPCLCHWRSFSPLCGGSIVPVVEGPFPLYKGHFSPLKRVLFYTYLPYLRTLLYLIMGPVILYSAEVSTFRISFFHCAKPRFAIVCGVSPPLFFAGAFSTLCAWFPAWFWAFWSLSLFLMQGLYSPQNVQGRSNIFQR